MRFALFLEPDPSGGVLGPSLAGKRAKFGHNQNLDFSSDPYFISNTLIPGNQLPNVPQGFITNFDVNGNPLPSNSNVLNNNVLVGGPNHFYFGLNNGKTAINRFIKKYINTTEE